MDAEEKALVKALLDKDAIVAGGVLYCAPVMLRAAAALTAALEDREDAERYRTVRANPAMLLHLKNSEFDAAIDARRSHG